jgi:hypothetical protein
MNHRRLCDRLAICGTVWLGLVIASGQMRAADARSRTDPLVVDLTLSDAQGRLLVARHAFGYENRPMTISSDLFFSPCLKISLDPLARPDGSFDVQLDVSIDGRASAPLRGLRLWPGRPTRLEVPGQRHRYLLTLVASPLRHRPERAGSRTPLLS